MTSLLDLKRRSVTVETSAGTVVVWAISISALAHLIGAFPFVKKLMDGKAESADFTVEKIVTLAPDLAAQLIAAGVNEAGNEEAIEAAADIAIGDQLALLAGVMEASMPKGAAPFREAILKLADGLSASGLKAPATK